MKGWIGIYMKNIVGVRLKKPGKIYFFDPGYIKLKNGDEVIIETENGQEFGIVAINSRKMPEDKIKTPENKIVRIATKKDKEHYLDNQKKEKEAFELCLKKIKEHKLDMNLIDVEYKFDNSKLLFFFTADGRVDFRDLVKELASIYKTRIELRQIGVRDEVKRIGGNGICGRELCCCTFLSNFETVSIKMAKEQNISLNPGKISGSCGRLMCCLKYEQEVYEEKLKKLPKIGAIVSVPEEGEGIVDSVETLKEQVKVKFKDKDGFFYKRYNIQDIKIIKDVETDNQNDDENDEELKALED